MYNKPICNKLDSVITQLRETLILLNDNKIDEAEVIFASVSNEFDKFFTENNNNTTILKNIEIIDKLKTIMAVHNDISTTISKLITDYNQPNTSTLREKIKFLKTYS